MSSHPRLTANLIQQLVKHLHGAITAADVKVPDIKGVVPSTFGNDLQKSGEAFVFAETSSGTEVEAIS